MTSIPVALPPEASPRDTVKRMHKFNTEMTRMSKDAARQIGTDGIEVILENLTQILGADFKDLETLDMPISVVKQTNLFAITAISRILWEMYKTEQSTGQKIKGTPLTEPEACASLKEEEEIPT